MPSNQMPKTTQTHRRPQASVREKLLEECADLLEEYFRNEDPEPGDAWRIAADRVVDAVRSLLPESPAPQGWQPIETAPKGGGAERTDDPAWVDPPRILASGRRGLMIVYWDWYYAEGGEGYKPNQTAWVDESGEARWADDAPTHWMPLPAPPTEKP